MRQLLQTLVCCLCCCPLAAAQETDAERKPASPEQCDKWIEQLANRSERPFKKSYVLDPPRNVDRKALADVKAAYDNLSKHFPDSLPSLIGGLEDRRYAYYQEVPSNGAFVCRDVGYACYHIISAHIEVYRRDLNVLARTGVPRSVHFLSAMGGVEKWYDARQKKSLFELQLEAVDWALKQPQDERVEQADWDKAKAELQKFRDEFAKSKRPFDPKDRLWFEGK